MRYLGLGRCLKSFLEVVHFIVTKYGTVGSYGDPIHTQNHGLGTEQMVLLWAPVTWAHLGPSDITWRAHVGSSAPIWDHLGSSGIIWNHLCWPWGDPGDLLEEPWQGLGGPWGSEAPQGSLEPKVQYLSAKMHKFL